MSKFFPWICSCSSKEKEYEIRINDEKFMKNKINIISENFEKNNKNNDDTINKEVERDGTLIGQSTNRKSLIENKNVIIDYEINHPISFSILAIPLYINHCIHCEKNYRAMIFDCIIFKECKFCRNKINLKSLKFFIRKFKDTNFGFKENQDNCGVMPPNRFRGLKLKSTIDEFLQNNNHMIFSEYDIKTKSNNCLTKNEIKQKVFKKLEEIIRNIESNPKLEEIKESEDLNRSKLKVICIFNFFS